MTVTDAGIDRAIPLTVSIYLVTTLLDDSKSLLLPCSTLQPLVSVVGNFGKNSEALIEGSNHRHGVDLHK